MSTAVYPSPYPLSSVQTQAESVSLPLRWLTCAIGLTLPIISLQSNQRITHSLLSRIETVDVICLITLLVLFFTRRLRLSLPIVLYFIVLLFSLPIAMSNGASFAVCVTAYSALMMAALYYLLGASIAPTPALVKAFMLGVALSALGEGFIVMHDFLLPGSRWFHANLENTVRGTFRSTAQLGNYGFATAGLLLCFGWAYFQKMPARAMVLLAGVMCVVAVLASSRRTGILALAIWVGLYLMVGFGPRKRKAYFLVIAATAVTVGMLCVFTGDAVWEHFFERVQQASSSAQSGESFTHMQFRRVMNNFDRWFPLGIGVGNHAAALEARSVFKANSIHEIHNGHLAVLVELGVVGAIVFNWLVLRALLRSWGNTFGQLTSTIKLATITFMLAAAVFMVHALPQRDRSSMIFLGMVPLIGIASLQPRHPVVMYVPKQ